MRKAASKLLHLQDSHCRLKNVLPASSIQGISSIILKRSSAKGFHDASTSDESDKDDKEKVHKGSGDDKRKPSQRQGQKEAQSSDEDDEKVGMWNSQLAWLNNILESAMSLYKRAVPPGESQKAAKPATTRSLVDIAFNLHKSTTTGMQQWSLGDLTFGLYLLSLHHASESIADAPNGEQISSPSMVADLIYHAELAKGAYMKSAASLARVSMLRESNVIKFIDSSSLMRPAYYIAVDTHEKLVVLGIRGTSSVHDMITDLVSHSDEEVRFDGGCVHYGTAKAAEWFIAHELPTLRQHLYKGFQLRLVGHSLGGATACLLAIMLRKKSEEELGFSPGIIMAVGFASPPCVSESLAIQSASFVRTVILQDDVIPRINAATLLKLRNEILGLDWASFLRKEAEERKGVLDLVASTVEALSSVQDVARRYAAYASFGPSSQKESKAPQKEVMEKSVAVAGTTTTQQLQPVEELFAPGSLYHIRGHPIFQEKLQKFTEGREGCTLWKVDSSQFLRRIVLTGSFFKDHKCDSYYQGLRDALKGL